MVAQAGPGPGAAAQVTLVHLLLTDWQAPWVRTAMRYTISQAPSHIGSTTHSQPCPATAWQPHRLQDCLSSFWLQVEL